MREPTALHLDFIRASEEEAEARSSAQRKQLEAMAAAQAERETALHEAEEAQRKRASMARIKNIALVGVSILGVLAGLLGWRSEQQRRIAEEQKSVAEEQREQADRILTGATNVFVKLHDQMDINTKKEVFAVFQTGAAHGDATAMRLLGGLYRDGFGVAQDFAKAREWYEKAADKGDGAANYYLLLLPIYEAAGAGRYGEALQLQEALATSKGTVGELYSVAWRALFARQFTKALTAADRVHALYPDAIEFEINRAHALMFLERGEEAKALYLAHKGKPVSGQDGKPWERVIAEDFAEFRKAGLTHPMMADIEKELGVSR